MRILIVGYGSMGQRHARNAARAHCDNKVLVKDATQHRLDAAHRDGHALYQGGPVDAAVIATPVATHRQVLIEIMETHREAGAECPALLVEKPLDIEPCAIWEEYPHPTAMVGYNWRFVDAGFGRVLGQICGPVISQQFGSDCNLVTLTTTTNMAAWPGNDYGDALLECSHDLDLAWSWMDGRVTLERAVHDRDRCSVLAWLSSGEKQAIVMLQYAAANQAPHRAYVGLSRNPRTVTYDLRTDQAAANLRGVEDSYLAEMVAFLNAAEAGIAGIAVPGAATLADGNGVVRLALEIQAAHD